MTLAQLEAIKEILKQAENLELDNEAKRVQYVRDGFGTIVRSIAVFLASKRLPDLVSSPLSLFLEYDAVVRKVMEPFFKDKKMVDPIMKATKLGFSLAILMDKETLKHLDKHDRSTLDLLLDFFDYKAGDKDPVEFLTEKLQDKYESVTADVLTVAMTRSYNLIKDIFDEGKKVINLIVTSELLESEVLDHYDTENNLVKKIKDSLILGEDTHKYKVPEWRAKLQARNEVMATLRDASYRADLEKINMMGLKKEDVYWEHMVIHDDRLSKICATLNLLPIRTEKQWDKVSPHWKTYGNHVNCRCTWSVAFDKPKKKPDHEDIAKVEKKYGKVDKELLRL